MAKKRHLKTENFARAGILVLIVAGGTAGTILGTILLGKFL